MRLYDYYGSIGLRHHLEETVRAPAAPSDPFLQQTWEHAVSSLGIPLFRLPSGAGHELRDLPPSGDTLRDLPRPAGPYSAIIISAPCRISAPLTTHPDGTILRDLSGCVERTEEKFLSTLERPSATGFDPWTSRLAPQIEVVDGCRNPLIPLAKQFAGLLRRLHHGSLIKESRDLCLGAVCNPP